MTAYLVTICILVDAADTDTDANADADVLHKSFYWASLIVVKLYRNRHLAVNSVCGGGGALMSPSSSPCLKR